MTPFIGHVGNLNFLALQTQYHRIFLVSLTFSSLEQPSHFQIQLAKTMVRYTAFLLAPVVTAFAPSSNLFPSPRVQRLAAEGNDASAPESENMVEDGDVESVLESSTGGEPCSCT